MATATVQLEQQGLWIEAQRNRCYALGRVSAVLGMIKQVDCAAALREAEPEVTAEVTSLLIESLVGAETALTAAKAATSAGAVSALRVTEGEADRGPTELAAHLQAYADLCYWQAFWAGLGTKCHALLEWNGLLQKYVQLCERAAKAGLDPSALNTRVGAQIPVHAHDMAYVGEKLRCIFGPVLDGNPEASEALRAALFGGSP